MFNLISYSILSISLFFSSLCIGTETQNLLNKKHLWADLQRHFDVQPQAFSSEKTTNNNVSLKHIKTIEGDPSFEHYETFISGFPLIEGNIVIARNKDGNIIQAMGNYLPNIQNANPDIFTLANLEIKKTEIEHILDQDFSYFIFEVSEAFIIRQKQIVPVYRADVKGSPRQNTPSTKMEYIFDAETLEIIKKSDTLNRSPLLVTGGGIGGNKKLGQVCYSPSPDSMTNCKAYRYSNTFPAPHEVIFSDSNSPIFSAFNGYPFVVTKDGTQCQLDNPYVVTTENQQSNPNDNSPYAYTCSASAELYEPTNINDSYTNYESYSALNDAHFHGGLVMQMYHRYLQELFPNQTTDCDVNGYCLKKLKQRTNVRGLTGGDMDQAYWDGDTVNYGNGLHYYIHTSLSIVAHETTHAITSWNSGLGAQDVAGAINEGFSDIGTIAAEDYLDRYMTGSFKQSQIYRDKTQDGNPQYQNNRRWWYGWDVMPFDTAGRYFEVPSWDGKSIDDARDYLSGNGTHYNGGALRKFFYKLVKEHNWSIEQAFKLVLRANVTCWTVNTDFDTAGACFLLQANALANPNIPNHAETLKQQIDTALHAVGIFAPSTGISTLPFASELQYNTVGFGVSSLNLDDMDSFELHWEGLPAEYWESTSGLPAYPLIYRIKSFSPREMVKLKLIANMRDGSKLEGYRTYFSRGKTLRCEPTRNVPIIHTDSLTVSGTDVPLSNTDYQKIETSISTSARTLDLEIANNAVGTNANLLVDVDRSGLFENNEWLIKNQPINNPQLTLILSNDLKSGPIFIRLALASSYSLSSECGHTRDGQIIDLVINIEDIPHSYSADFSHSASTGNTVAFSHNLQTPPNNGVDDINHWWEFGDGKTSHQANPTHNYGSAGAFTVRHAVYKDNIKVSEQTKSVNASTATPTPPPSGSGGGGGGSAASLLVLLIGVMLVRRKKASD